MDSETSVPDAVLAAYGVEAAHIELLSGGRVNRTLRVRAGQDLVLQQMLGSAHGDLLGIMENLVRVTQHLDWRRNVEKQGATWYPTLTPTAAGKPYLMTDVGDVWRAFTYRTGQIVRSAQPLRTLASAAALYGRFTSQTHDLGGPPLIATAPGFHDLDAVFEQFHLELDAAEPAQRQLVASEIDRITATRHAVEARCALDGAVWADTRVVHNDTKLSNVLFDRDHGRSVAVLDLDLMMMGPSWHDVGDLIRSASWHAPAPASGSASGDDPDFSVELFTAVVGAFVGAAGETLTDDEISTYAVAGPRLSFELGVRYLTDHLRTTPHLQVAGHHGHLNRGLANVKLAEEMLAAYDALRHGVDGFVDSR